MKAEEKAKELVDIFRNETAKFVFIRPELSKQCALKCADEMLLELEDIEDGYRTDRVEYWYKVKQEIDKL